MAPSQATRLFGGVLFLATTVAADDDTELAFNLFSDIAPVLALFGEQFATQFMSESLTWLDHLIFAMVPLGILTVITGAIRVQGPRIAKSFIGRARENRALAEIELMSSTSGEVCELFNGKSIIRAMGSPMLEQFLIFPQVYDDLQAKYKPLDQRHEGTSEATPPDKSCGIHTPISATSTEQGMRRERLMECRPFHSYSYELFQSLLAGLTKKAALDEESSTSLDPDAPKSYKWLGPPNLQLNLSSNHFEKAWMRKRHELFLAAVVAVTLQLSLLAIAAVTVFHQPTRNSIGTDPTFYGFPCYVAGTVLLCLGMAICSLAVEHNSVEHSWEVLMPDKQKDGKQRGNASKNDLKANHQAYPRLVWLQSNQTVSDQAFDSYAILAGPKRYIVSSSRIEDTEKWSKKSAGEQPEDSDDEPSELEPEEDFDGPKGPKSASDAIWELLTMFGVFASGVGFVAQFMGLRGLTYPCSIAQLVAIFIMALVRAIIRRRLGRIPAHCVALSRYELDFLATHITFCPKFRRFQEASNSTYPYLRQSPDLIWQWGVDTAKPQDERPFLFRSSKEITNSGSNPDHGDETTKTSESNSKTKASNDFSNQRLSYNPHFEPATSQQLLRVRERLGDLCGWTSDASESALVLVQSIELFMNTFFPASAEQQLDSLDWVIETLTPPSSTASRKDFITIPVTRVGEKFDVDIGKIEAVLSLWMANIEAKRVQERKRDAHKRVNWRRAKAESGTKYKFCRILGDDFGDGVLTRDLSWWVDEAVVEGITTREEASKPGIDGFRKWHQCRGRAGEIDLVIGFNGRGADPRRSDEEDMAIELSNVSSATLPTILAQHLFTSFMWTVAEQLPRNCLNQQLVKSQQDIVIEGQHKFNPQAFKETWQRPGLRHRQLTKMVHQMEKYGLGNPTDILLCMIPSLSFHDVLPNHHMLKLLAPANANPTWAKTGASITDFLQTGIRPNTEESFCYALVVEAMEFLYLACQPYYEYIQAPWNLWLTNNFLIRTLVDDGFAKVLKELAPIYEMQHRLGTFASIFEQERQGILDEIGDKEASIAKFWGFSKLHRSVYEATKDPNVDPDFHLIDAAQLTMPDIFGWTPLHYAAFIPQKKYLVTLIRVTERTRGIHTMLNKSGRSPIHIAAANGIGDALGLMLSSVRAEDHEAAVSMSGLDGMTPLHLATRSGSMECVELLLKGPGMQCVTQVDCWGREAIHIAASIGNATIVARLLKAGARVGAVDKDGRSVIDYLFAGGCDLRNDEPDESEQTSDAFNKEDPEDDDNQSQDSIVERRAKEIRDKRAIFRRLALGMMPDESEQTDDAFDEEESEDLEDDDNQSQASSVERRAKEKRDNRRTIFMDLTLAMPDYRDGNGATFLHRAVESLDSDIIGKLLQKGLFIDVRDSKGQTPLHHAILARRERISLALIDGIGGQKADPSIKDKTNATTVMFAAKSNQTRVIQRVLETQADAAKDIDDEGQSPLHYALRVEEDQRPESVDLQLVRLLVEKGCDPVLRDSEGMTALHLALHWSQYSNIVKYFLEETPIQEDPMSSDGDTLLRQAAYTGNAAAIRRFLQRWPGMVNDRGLMGTPLVSFACRARSLESVRAFVEQPNIDLNVTEGTYHDTPLHTAVLGESKKILRLLLEQDSIDVNARNDSGETALDKAVNQGDVGYAAMLLLHCQTTDEVRIRHLKLFTSELYERFKDLVADVTAAVKDDSFTDDDLTELIKGSARSGAPELVHAYLAKATQRRKPSILKTCCHAAAGAGNLDIVKALAEHGADPGELDEDNWSCVDHAARHGHEDVVDELKAFLQSLAGPMPTRPPYVVPRCLDIGEMSEFIHVGTCSLSGHQGCKVCDVRVHTLGDYDAMLGPVTIDTLRSRNCLPPPTSSTKHYYYEVTILGEPQTTKIDIGFCHGDTPTEVNNTAGAWVYCNNGWLRSRYRTIGFDVPVPYETGDVVGVGTNLETGEGFCTLNGRRLDVGTCHLLV